MPCVHFQILDGAEYAIDVFDTAYCTELAAAGHALVFPLQPSSLQPDSATAGPGSDGTQLADEHAETEALQAAEGSRDTVSTAAALSPQQDLSLDFSDVALREDKSPLLHGCICYTCSKYSRAYLHHLVHSEEMLAPVLLEMHNTHHMQSWFAVLRSTVSAGGFGQYAAWFRASFRVPAPVARKPLADAVPIA